MISLYVNGSLIESDDSAGNDADISDTITLKIGSNRTKDDSFFQGQQSDYIISDSVGFSADWIKADYYAQTNTLLTTGYLAHKWGLEANLPSDHPYKSTAPTT